MQVEQKRSCIACGSESAPDASFCWRCLQPFAQVPPPPPIGIGHPPPNVRPGLAHVPGPRTATRAGSSKFLAAVVAVVAGLAGYIGVQYVIGSDRSLPQTLAGETRLTDPTSLEFERFTASEGERYGIDAEGGVYGTGVQPRFFVILVDEAAIETTDELFDALLTGFTQAGASVESAATSGRRGESDYRCVTARASGRQAVACMWRDADNVGIVFETSGSTRSARRLLWTIHDTIVA